MLKFQLTTILYFSAITAVTTSLPSMATGITVSTGQFEQFLDIANQKTKLTPQGVSISGNVDITDTLNLSANYGKYEEETNRQHRAKLEFEKNTWGVGVSYYLGRWGLSARYGFIEEDIDISRAPNNLLVYKENFESDSYSLSTNYGFTTENKTPWYISFSSSVLYNDWNLSSLRVNTPLTSPSSNSGVEAGDSTSIDISITAASLYSMSESIGLYYGSSITWNHLISGESGVISRNGKSINQIIAARATSRNGLNSSYFSQSIDGEEYGLLSLFLSYEVGLNWSFDIDYSSSFLANQNTQSTYLSLNYQF